MSRVSLLCLLVFVLAIGSVRSGDLYEVSLKSDADAALLKQAGAECIYSMQDKVLVIVESSSAVELGDAGLSMRLLADDVSVSDLAIDGRKDRAYVDEYELVYELDSYRLYRVDFDQLSAMDIQPQLFPIGPVRPEIAYRDQTRLDRIIPPTLDQNLGYLMGEVSRDTIWQYSHELEDFYRRVAGTSSNYASRDWIIDRLVSYGYDSVVVDSFQESFDGGEQECQNVLAYKVGTVYPNAHVIVGAHRDAVYGSPGADDNGSGTVGVLEIARALKDVDTEMTFVFALFDAEEWGLHGAWHYLNDRIYPEDTIIYMLNMDMIGWHYNYNEANLFHGNTTQYSELWQHLADSLVGLYGVLAGGSSSSDHYPFAQAGYDVTFVAEYYFSQVYHSYRDSTSYIDYDYMTKMIKASLATVYQVSQTATPRPSLAISIPGGSPSMLPPEQSYSFDVTVESRNLGAVVPDGAVIHYSIDDAPYVESPLVDQGGGVYQAGIPVLSCGSSVWYYVSAEEEQGQVFCYPGENAPLLARAATDSSVVFGDDFSTDNGWLTTHTGTYTGQWERGTPVNDGAWYADPVSDADGGGQCFVTDNGYGATDVDDGSVSLWSPVFELPEGGVIEYDYYLYLSNDDGADGLSVEVNNNYGSGDWIEAVRHDTHGGLLWRHSEISSDDLVALGMELTSAMRVRFVAKDSSSQSTVEAGVDNFYVTLYDCVSCCGTYTGGFTGNTNCSTDGKVTLSDITQLIDRVYISKEMLCCEPNGNVNGSTDGNITLSDITRLIDNVYISRDPTALCP